MQLIVLLCLFLLSPSAFTRRLTEEENVRLKKTCGADRLKMGFCSAVQISSRHILTAAHCLLWPKFDEDSIQLRCDAFLQENVDPKIVTKTLYTATPPEGITVYVSSSCERPQMCPDSAKFTITTPPQIQEEYNPCTAENDLALIELDREIPTEIGTPICLRENEELAQRLTSVGYGFDPNHPDPPIGNWLQKIDFHSENVQESDTMITTFHREKSTCIGDSGGPLVQLDHNNKYILVGILSSGNSECSETIPEEEERENYYTNLRGYLDWICTHSDLYRCRSSRMEMISIVKSVPPNRTSTLF